MESDGKTKGNPQISEGLFRFVAYRSLSTWCRVTSTELRLLGCVVEMDCRGAEASRPTDD